MTSAKIILDSWNGLTRLTTMEIKFHRFILPEFNTHRMFSRNAASSRAIPVRKQIEEVDSNPALPVFWGKNQPGMSAYEEVKKIDVAEANWVYAKNCAIETVEDLIDKRVDLHKQLATRLLEPFMWCTMIVTATEWDNFFNLRAPLSLIMTPDFPAQPEMQVLAIEMKKALNASDPIHLRSGEWHIPYLRTNIREDDCEYSLSLPDKLRVSVARCARVSYLTHDTGKVDVQKDLALADRLMKDKHMSPFEHQAVCTSDDKFYKNFRGWNQYRSFVEMAQVIAGSEKKEEG